MSGSTTSYPAQRYTAAAPQTDARFRPAGAEVELATVTTEIGYLATSITTDGEFGLYRYTMTGQPGGPDPHFHRTISESFFIISGQVRLYDGRTWIDATAGDFLYVPVGSVHAFRNESGQRADMLLLFAPGAPRESYFEANAQRAAAGGSLNPDELLEFLRLHDQYAA